MNGNRHTRETLAPPVTAPSDALTRMDLTILGANLLMWILFPLLNLNSTLGMWISIASCIWHPSTALFLVGLSECAFQEGAFRDLTITPGQLVLGALLVRALVTPGLNRTLAMLRRMPAWFSIGLMLYGLPIVLNSIYHDNQTLGYAAIANVASAVALLALGSQCDSRLRMLQALMLGFLPSILYYFLALLGLMAPVTSCSSDIGQVMAAGRMNPNATARSIVMLALLALYCLLQAPTRPWRWFSLATCFGTLAVLPVTSSRGGLVAIVIGVSVMAAGMRFRRLRQTLVRLGAGGLILAAATLVAPQLGGSWSILRELSQSSLASAWEESTGSSEESARRELWFAAVDHFSRNPIMPDYQAYRDEMWLMTHNTFLEIGLHGGILALTGILVLWTCSLWQATLLWWRERHASGGIVLALLSARLVSAFLTAMTGDKIFLMICAFLALSQAYPAWSFGAVQPPGGVAADKKEMLA